MEPAEPKIELHPKSCSCRGGSWAILGTTSVSPCSGPGGPQTDTVTLTVTEWRNIGKPPNLDDYKEAVARIESGDRREFQRYEARMKVRMSRLPSWKGETTQTEDTFTEVIALGGALVASRMAVERGDVLLFGAGTFQTRAEVRYVSASAKGDAFLRLGLRFLDAPLPEALIPKDARPID
jgi:hypothetical protein